MNYCDSLVGSGGELEETNVRRRSWRAREANFGSAMPVFDDGTETLVLTPWTRRVADFEVSSSRRC
jgi:hypothetical protein